jgi:hypothetical protein
MSMFFRYDGSLSFESETKAQEYYKLLTADADSWFRSAPDYLELSGETITFKNIGNFNSYSSCEKTKDLINEAARNATKGKVKVDEGDGEDNLWNKELISVASLRKQQRKRIAPANKIYKFTGQLQFADEETAKAICKTLLTDAANSLFPKFEREYEGDKREIRFNKKNLSVEAQCAGTSSLFKKTEKLLKKAKEQSVSGQVDVKEVEAPKFMRDSDAKGPEGWVSDMEMDLFYRITGSMLYHSAKEAEEACQKLLSDSKSIFSITGKYSFPVYVSKEVQLIFDDMGNCPRKILNDTGDLIREVAVLARRGKVTCAFSFVETMDTFMADRFTPAKERKRIN